MRALDDDWIGGMSPATVLVAMTVCGGVVTAMTAMLVYVAASPENANHSAGGIAFLLVGIALIGLLACVLYRVCVSGVKVAGAFVIVRNLRDTHELPVSEVADVRLRGTRAELHTTSGHDLGMTGFLFWGSPVVGTALIEEGLDELRSRVGDAQRPSQGATA